MWGLYQTEKKLTVIQKLSWRFSRSIVPTLNTQDLRELVKKNLWRCPKKVIPVQNCMENPFFGVSRPYKGLLETYPNTCWKGLISKCSAKVPQNRKKEYCSFKHLQFNFWAFWALFGAAWVLYLPLFQLHILALAPLCLSRKEMAGTSVLDPFSGDYSIRN